MKPIDFRNATFTDLQERISGQREAVLRAWQQHGPCTTEELAERSGISILTLRPRTTELYQIGYLVLAENASATTKGGVYRTRSTSELLAWFNTQQREAAPGQRMFSLT